MSEEQRQFSDRQTELGLLIEKARTIASEIFEDFFSLAADTQTGRFAILYGFGRGRVFMDILDDYLYQIQTINQKPMEERT